MSVWREWLRSWAGGSPAMLTPRDALAVVVGCVPLGRLLDAIEPMFSTGERDCRLARPVLCRSEGAHW
jgi:hypothetical protein